MWDGACSGGGLVYPRGTLQSIIHKGARRRRMLDSSGTRRHHSQTRRQGNPGRREVWRVIQAEKRNTIRGGVSRISLKGSSSRGGASKKTATGRDSGQSVAGRRKVAFGQGSRWPMPWR